MASHKERFSQLAPLYELLDATFRSNAAGKQVNLLIEAPSGAGKTTILKQYEGLPGITIKDGNISKYECLTKTKELKNKGIHTLIHEDISKIVPEKERLMVVAYWHMLLDHHVLNEQFNPHVDEYVFVGLILTAPTGNIDGRTLQHMTDSGFKNRLLHIRFNASRDVSRLLSQAIRHKNVHKTTIEPIQRMGEDELAQFEDEVYEDTNLSGNQSSQILNLIEYGCSLETIKKLLKGDLVLE